MGPSTDVLSRATPTRLLCRGGRWTLELTRLEAVDRDVFQPRLTRLEGSDTILAALRRSEEGQHLVTGAAQIMRGSRADEDRAFEVSEGDWVPSAEAAPPVRQEADTDDGSVRLLIAELRAELSVLRASHSRLRERVIALEAAQSGLPPGPARPARGSRHGRRRSEPPPGLGLSPAPVEQASLPLAPEFAATQASPGVAPARPAPAPAPAAEAAAPSARQAPAGDLPQTFEELAKAVVGEQLQPPLAPPPVASLGECLTTLLGVKPTLETSPEVPFERLRQPYCCQLLDDEGATRGVIVLDLKGAVQLGAMLLGLPSAEAERQIGASEPTEDTLLAVSEICNNLTGPVNATAGNQHVRSTALSPLDVATLPKPRARLDLRVDGGYLILAMY